MEKIEARYSMSLWWCLAGLLVIALGIGIFQMDLRGEEPRRALVAWEMLISDRWGYPSMLDNPYYNKPPLFNWILMPGIFLAGRPATWIVRLPGLLALIVTAIWLYRWVAAEYSKELGLWSAAILLTGLHLLFFGSILTAEIDLTLALAIFGQAYCIYQGIRRGNRWLLFLGSYFCMSLGFLLKGLPAIAFQGVTLFAIGAVEKRWQTLFHWKHLVGALAGLLPVVLYFSWYEHQYGTGMIYLRNLFLEASQKSGGGSQLTEIALHLVTFPLQILLAFLPWGLWAFHLRRKAVRTRLWQQPLLRFSAIFVLANVVLYWLSPESRDRYLYPVFPFIALLLAWLLVEYGGIGRKRSMQLLAVLVGLRLIYAWLGIPAQQRNMESRERYHSIRDRIQGDSKGDPIVFTGSPDTVLLRTIPGFFSGERDTLFVPPSMPRQIPLGLSIERREVIPYRKKPNWQTEVLYVYSSVDSIGPERDTIRSYRVWGKTRFYHLRISSEE